MVAQFLPFQCSSILFSWLAVTSLHPTNRIVGMPFSTNPSAFIVCRRFTDGILNIGWRNIFVVWICIQPVITDIELLSMFFFFLNSRVSNSYVFKQFSWKVFHVVNFFGHSLPQDMFWRHESFTALQSLWMLVTISSRFKAAVWGDGLRVAAFLRWQLCLLGKYNLAASCAFRLQIRVECARTKPHKF